MLKIDWSLNSKWKGKWGKGLKIIRKLTSKLMKKTLIKNISINLRHKRTKKILQMILNKIQKATKINSSRKKKT